MEEIVIPTLAETRVLIQFMKDEQKLKEVREQARLAAHGHHGLRETKPLCDGKDDFARFTAFIPPQFYWSRRQKYGKELFTTDAGLKDLKKHHPEFFTKTVSGQAVSGYTGHGDTRTETGGAGAA